MATMYDFKKEEKKRKRQERLQQAAQWFYENKEWVIPLTIFTAGAVAKGVKMVDGHAKLKQKADLKDKRFYDNKLGCYWHLKRKLNNDELRMVEVRKANGEQLGKILKSMNVLE